jgi:hypothetical protein
VGTAAVGGAGAAYHKQGSVLDEVAGEQAVTLAMQGGFDVDQAIGKVASVLELGLGDSEKVASAADYPTSVSIRALEILEAAGYPVTWNA